MRHASSGRRIGGMRRFLLPAIMMVSAVPAFAAPTEASASQYFAKGSSPQSVAESLATDISRDPSLSPSIVLDAVGIFASKISGAELESAVSEIFRALASSAPDSLLQAIRAVVEKYPALAVAVAHGSSKGNPGLARKIAETVADAAPSTDREALGNAVAEAVGLEYGEVSSWLSGSGSWESAPATAFPGGGGGPAPYSN